jgi:hypothetical protein
MRRTGSRRIALLAPYQAWNPNLRIVLEGGASSPPNFGIGPRRRPQQKFVRVSPSFPDTPPIECLDSPGRLLAVDIEELNLLSIEDLYESRMSGAVANCDERRRAKLDSLPNAPAMMASFTRRSCLPGFLLLASQLPNVQQICHPQSSIGRIRGTLLFSGSLRLSQTERHEQRLYLHPQSRLEHQL